MGRGHLQLRGRSDMDVGPCDDVALLAKRGDFIPEDTD